MLQQHLTVGLFLLSHLFLKGSYVEGCGSRFCFKFGAGKQSTLPAPNLKQKRLPQPSTYEPEDGLTSVIGGPSIMEASLGKTLCVKCQYEKYYYNYKKYWCKGPNWTYCEIVIETDETEKEKRVGRTVIKDNHTQFEFTVKMENITKEDAGIYWCAIDKPVAADFKWEVNITVTEELPPTAFTTTEYFSTATNFPAETTGRSPDSDPDLIILLPVVLGLLVLILTGTTLFMWKLKKKKATKNSKGLLPSMVSPSSDQATDGTEVSYTTVTPTRFLASKSQVSENTEKVDYASFRFSTLNDQPIYANV